MVFKNSYEKYVSIIFECIEKRKNVDYGDKNSVRAYNRAYDRCIQYIFRIDSEYPERLDEFLDTVISAGDDAIEHCVSFFFRMQNSTVEQRQRAQDCMRAFLLDPNVDELAKMVIKTNFEDGWYRV